MSWFKQISENLKKDWIKYGFETLAVVVGILGAFALGNWKENRELKQKEVTYLHNISNDLERQLSIIEAQRVFEQQIISDCELILDLIHEPPYDIERLNIPLSTLGRKHLL